MRLRFFILLIIFSIVILIWTVYLFYLQIFDPLNLDCYRQLRYKPSKELLIPARGSILDCNGTLFVSSVAFHQADIDRKQVNDWAPKNGHTLAEAYNLIAEAFEQNTTLTKEQVLARLKLNDKLTSIQINNKIKESELEKLIKHFDDNKLPGLTYAFSSMKRIYSKGLTAARLLGSVKEMNSEYDPGDPVNSLYKLSGINGLEATYNKELTGQFGWREVFYDANNNRVPYPNLRDKKPVNGLNIWLTIDPAIQDVAETSLAEGLQLYGAKNAAAVVMDVNTGKILAMAGVSADDYHEDPGFVRVKSNIPVSFLFEPGSTMKPFTALTALDYNLIKPNETFPSGTRMIGIRKIADTHSYGPLNTRGVIAKSSNVGISLIGDSVGSKRLYEKLILLGFGQKSGLNLFGESSGIFHKLEDWDGYSLHSITFGYALSVSATQLAAAYSVIANGGNYVRPYIVDSFRDETGRIIEQFEPKIVRRVVKQEAADTLKSYLQSVVEEGTARHIKLSYMTTAGKTGTAKKKLEGQTGYSDKYTGNFVGFFPVDNPEMVVAVVYDEPYFHMRYGGLCAAPTFQKIVENTLFLPSCQILPKNKRMQQISNQTPHLIGMSLNNAESLLKQHGLNYKIEIRDSSLIITDQFPKPNVALDKTYPILLITGKVSSDLDRGNQIGAMPNLVGLTLRNAIKASSHNNVKLKIQGKGIVRKQSITAGSKIITGSVCAIEASL